MVETSHSGRSPHTISVEAARCDPLQLHGDVILIATGSYPSRPHGFPFTDPRIHDSDTILTLHEMIRTGELTRRREETGAGAGVRLDAPPVAVGTPE